MQHDSVLALLLQANASNSSAGQALGIPSCRTDAAREPAHMLTTATRGVHTVWGGAHQPLALGILKVQRAGELLCTETARCRPRTHSPEPCRNRVDQATQSHYCCHSAVHG